VGADSGGGSGYYYSVSSEDGDGDESVRSLGVRPASAGGSSGLPVACFIGAVAQAIPQKGLWMLAVLTLTVVVAHWRTAQGTRRKSQD
jgi:hypothetical protein